MCVYIYMYYIYIYMNIYRQRTATPPRDRIHPQHTLAAGERPVYYILYT